MRRGCCLSNWRIRGHLLGLVAPRGQGLRRDESYVRFMMELTMPINRALIGIVMTGLSLSLAAAQQQQVIVIPNNMFTAAGFMVKYATTPEKRALLNSLPPDKLVKRTKDGIVYYVYADAARCNCAYAAEAVLRSRASAEISTRVSPPAKHLVGAGKDLQERSRLVMGETAR